MVAWSIFNLAASSRDDQCVTPSRFGGVITVCRLTSSRSAIPVWLTPSAASSTIRARCANPACTVDDRVHTVSRSRSHRAIPKEQLACHYVPHHNAQRL
jgi:hypothetical protein